MTDFNFLDTNILVYTDDHDNPELHHFSFWDALIIQTAISAGCSTLFSEDLQHRQHINNLQIINPFKP